MKQFKQYIQNNFPCISGVQIWYLKVCTTILTRFREYTLLLKQFPISILNTKTLDLYGKVKSLTNATQK